MPATTTKAKALEKPQKDLQGNLAEKTFKDLKRKGGEVCPQLRYAKNKKPDRKAQKAKVKGEKQSAMASLSSVFIFIFYYEQAKRKLGIVLSCFFER